MVCNGDLVIPGADLIQRVGLAAILLAALPCQLVEDLPVDLDAFDTSVFDHKGLLDRL